MSRPTSTRAPTDAPEILCVTVGRLGEAAIV